MSSTTDYKVVSVNDHHNYRGSGLDKFRSVNVESIPTSDRLPIIRNTLFTMENAKVGDKLTIDKEELTAVLGQMTMFVYRPNSALSPFFNVVSRVPNEGMGLPEDIMYLVERNAKKGYEPVQAKVLSAMDFNKGDQMQVSMVNLYTTTRSGEKLYRFQDKEYQTRLWDSIKQLGR